EILGRLVAFAGLAIAMRSLRDRTGWKEPLLAGSLLGVAVGIHLIPVMIAAAFVVAYAGARILADRRFARIALRAAVAGALAVIVGAVILVLPHGNVGLHASGGEVAGDLGPCFDPTRYLNSGVVPDPSCTAP